MKIRLPAALAFVALAGSGLAFAAANEPPTSAPAKLEKPEFTPADRAAFLDARIAALHAGLKLTPDQEKLWPPLEAAVRASVKSAMERLEKRRNAAQKENIIDRLRERGESAVEHGQNIQAIAAAAAPLYAALNEDQKRRLPILMREMWAFHRFAMRDGGHWGWRMGGHRDERMGMRGGHDARQEHGREATEGMGGPGQETGRDGQAPDDDE